MSNIKVDYDILNQKQTPAFYASSLATRPAFGFTGRIFIDTDTPSSGIYRDTGSAWVQVADPGAGTTGTLQQVTTNGSSTTVGISTSGNGIGIGTTIPASNKLDIHSTSGINATFNGTGTSDAALQLQNAGTGKWNIQNLYNAGANSFQVYDVLNSTARLTILNTGATTLNGALTSTSVAITGGTSAQFLKADGTVDSNTYITTNSTQTIASGITKTFNNEMRFGLGTMYNNSAGVSLATGFTSINAVLTGSDTILQVWNSNGFKLSLQCNLTSSGSSFTLPSGQTNALIATAIGTSSQLIAGDGSLISAGTNITISGGTIASSGGGSITLSAIGSTPNANAATLTGSALNLEPASASFGGVVTTGTQSFAGAKTFGSSITASSLIKSGGTSAQILAADGSVITAGTNITISGGTIASSSITLSAIGSTPNANAATLTGSALNLQPASDSFGGVVTTGTQSFAGSKTFNSNVGINTTQIGANLEVNSGTTTTATLNIYNKITTFNANTLYATLNLGTNTAGNSVNLASINGYNLTSATSGFGYMTFGTRASGNIIERLRIASDGLVGINTTTSGSQLQVNGNVSIGYSASTAASSNGLKVNGRGNFLNAVDNSLFSLNSGGTLYTVGFSPTATANSTNTLTLTTAQTTWIYTGTGTATWTLPNPSGTNQMFWIKNAGTGIITLNAYTGTNIIDNSAVGVSSIAIAIGATVLIQQDGNVKSYQLQ